jgi:hypothetical protein
VGLFYIRSVRKLCTDPGINSRSTSWQPQPSTTAASSLFAEVVPTEFHKEALNSHRQRLTSATFDICGVISVAMLFDSYSVHQLCGVDTLLLFSVCFCHRIILSPTPKLPLG